MSSREWIFRLEDILNALERIQQYTQNLDFKQFECDQRTIDAVVRNLEIIGEAACHIPDTITEKYPFIPWKYMKSMRNLLIHEYFGIDVTIIWESVVNDLTSLHLQIENIKNSTH